MRKHSINSEPKQCRSCDAKVSGYRNYCPPCQRIKRKEFTETNCLDCNAVVSKESIRCQSCRNKFMQVNAVKKYCKCGVEISIVSNNSRKCFNVKRKARDEQETGTQSHKLSAPVPGQSKAFDWLVKYDLTFARMFARLNTEQQRLAAQSINITRRRFAKEQVTSGLSESIKEILDDAKKDIYFCLELDAERGKLPTLEPQYSSPLYAVITNG